MPDHAYLLVHPAEEIYDISKLLLAIKRPASAQMRKHLEAVKSPVLKKLSMRDRANHAAFRFWQEGPGHDRNVACLDQLHRAVDYIHHHPVKRGMVPHAGPLAWVELELLLSAG